MFNWYSLLFFARLNWRLSSVPMFGWATLYIISRTGPLVSAYQTAVGRERCLSPRNVQQNLAPVTVTQILFKVHFGTIKSRPYLSHRIFPTKHSNRYKVCICLSSSLIKLMLHIFKVIYIYICLLMNISMGKSIM